MKSMVGGCCVCSDERGWDENPLVYCDGQGCNVAVHQACYGIVTVPSGPWFCRKCESQERSARVRCELCPSRDGALKKTDSSGWAHVVCALYIPEVRFGNVTTMEPILISLIPPERFNKTCYICDDKKEKASVGACMQCNKAGCRQNFHVTCAQYKGLLCEEAGNMMDNVKYCGYCEYHYGKLRKTSNMKIIPPFKPVPNSTGESPASSPEKNPKHGTTESPVNNGGNSANNASASNSHISPDTANKNSSSSSKHSLKKSSTGSISGKTGSIPPTNNSGSSSTSSSTNPSPIPRIQPTNVFSSGAFSSNLSSSGRHSEDKSKGHGPTKLEEEVHVKGEDGHSHHHSHSHRSSSSSSSKFSIKAKDYSSISMTDVVTSALDRPISGGLDPPTSLPLSSSSHRDRVDKPPPPPDIKPHVTLTPIPMRSSDESKMDRPTKSPALTFPSSFGQASKLLTSPEMVAAQETKTKNESELSERFDAATPTKRQRPNQPVENYDSETDSASETWPSRMEDESESQSGSLSRTETHMSRKERFLGGSRHSPARMMTPQPGQDMGLWETNSSRLPQVSLERMRFSGREGSPFNSKLYSAEYNIPKRGPGRPVKRRSGTSRDDEGPDMKVPARSRGRRGGSSTGGYSRRETKDNSGLNNSNGSIDDRESTFDDAPFESGSVGSASRGGRHSGATRKVISSNSNSSNSLSKRPNYEEGPTMSFSQLKAQSTASGDKAPAHMFGNLLNPASSMAQKMVDSLSQEMETIAEVTENTAPQTPLVGISFPGKSNSTAVVANGTTTAPSAAPPQTLEELLERQWEQGSQFLMEQAQHLDIAQLLSCLNQLKQDNRALEDHVASLIQRKEHLSAINARLSIPLGSSGSLVNLGPAYSNHGPGSHGTPPLGQQQVNNKNISSVTSHNGSGGPSPQLQQQIMQESVVHQSRIPTHPFPGTESIGHGHHSSHHGHPHRDRDRGHNSGQSQMYGFPGGHSHQHGHSQSSGLPVPVVVASHSSPSQQHAPNSHHPSMSRDSR